jgi:hypothetical protein
VLAASPSSERQWMQRSARRTAPESLYILRARLQRKQVAREARPHKRPALSSSLRTPAATRRDSRGAGHVRLDSAATQLNLVRR